jgi:hypothetical protein
MKIVRAFPNALDQANGSFFVERAYLDVFARLTGKTNANMGQTADSRLAA